MKKPSSSGGRRLQTDPFIKAAAHPTRQTILKSLKEKALSTIELEKLTGENRYNLYHHLALLRDAGLIDYELEDSRAKRYFLKEEAETPEKFFQLERSDPEDAKAFVAVLDVLAKALGGSVPAPDEVESLSVLLTLRRN